MGGNDIGNKIDAGVTRKQRYNQLQGRRGGGERYGGNKGERTRAAGQGGGAIAKIALHCRGLAE